MQFVHPDKVGLHSDAHRPLVFIAKTEQAEVVRDDDVFNAHVVLASVPAYESRVVPDAALRQKLVFRSVVLPGDPRKVGKQIDLHSRKSEEKFVLQNEQERMGMVHYEVPALHLLVDLERKEDRKEVKDRDHGDQRHEHKKAVTDNASPKRDPGKRYQPQQ